MRDNQTQDRCLKDGRILHMKLVTCAGTTLQFYEDTLSFSIKRKGTTWDWATDYTPKFTIGDESLYFQSAKTISHKDYITGLGQGVISHYEGFQVNGSACNLAFETIVWIEQATGDVFFEWIPCQESDVCIKEIYWPGYMSFDTPKEDWYTLLNIQQGLLIPNTWNVALEKLYFDGLLCTAGAYMPWFSQIKEHQGYIAICEQPWDSAFYAEHPENGPFTHVGMKWGPSLGKIAYRRTMKYSFLSDCTYNDICKVYRAYVKEKGLFCSLSEKSAKAPSVNRLIGSSFMHKGIKTQVMTDSEFFDPTNPNKNNNLTPFDARTKEIRHYHDLGFEKLYLHLDGWAEPGYDNQHPDYLPACEAAGGWEGLKTLTDTIQSCGYLFGIHDQYRDYYFAAKTFDKNFGCQQMNGELLEHSRWAGGHQTYLCATQAPFYVKRNFTEIAAHDVHLDCAYLDVFTCNDGDECNHPWHRMTRRECFEFRGLCFEYLLSQGILPSSEEVTDWSMKSLVFAHYAPYNFMMHQPGTPQNGIAVPLFNLVYHDCVIEPWIMDKVSEYDDYMLYALLNGGAPYFIRDAAYQNIDGAFQTDFSFTEKESYERCQIVAKLHERIAKCEMVSHEFIDNNYQIQRTTFSDGTTVTIDLTKQSYQIT